MVQWPRMRMQTLPCFPVITYCTFKRGQKYQFLIAYNTLQIYNTYHEKLLSLCIYVGPHMENIPVYIMDVPASILGRAVLVLMVGPINYGLHLYGDCDLSMFFNWSGVFFLFYW